MSNNIKWHEHSIRMENREERYGHRPAIIWFTGLSGSGKSTIANALEKRLFDTGHKTYLLDGDNVRHGLNGDLGFSDQDREENIRRVAEVAKLFYDAGLIVICAFISPFEKERRFARGLIDKGRFVEIFLSTDISVCAKRDPKGLYKKVEDGDIRNFTGIDSKYECPLNPELSIDTSVLDIESCVDTIYNFLIRELI